MDALYYFPVVAVALAVAVILWRVLARRAVKPRPGLPFTKRSALLTPAELRFYQALREAAPGGLAVFVKVRLMDLVAVPDASWRQYGAPASGMHLDFVLADAATTEPRLAVELDDRSHWREDAQRRDAFKGAALAAAGLPLLRIPAAVRYDVADLRAAVRAAIR